MIEVNGLLPIEGRIIVKPIQNEQSTESGILLSLDKDSNEALLGEVVSCFPSNAINVKSGDRVFYSRYGFDEIQIGAERYCIVSEACILAKF